MFHCRNIPQFILFKNIYLGLCRVVGTAQGRSLVSAGGDYSVSAIHGLLIAVISLVAEHGV